MQSILFYIVLTSIIDEVLFFFTAQYGFAKLAAAT